MGEVEDLRTELVELQREFAAETDPSAKIEISADIEEIRRELGKIGVRA